MRRGVILVVVAVLSTAVPAWTRPAQEVPQHLEPALEELGPVRIPVLVPPERPFGTTATVSEGTRRSYRLLFTNDPEGSLSHVEQVNVFVSGSAEDGEPPGDTPPGDVPPVSLRGTDGTFFCGAAACFLEWAEDGATFSVGEFGSPEDAVGFAESLVHLEEILYRPDDGAETPPPGDQGLTTWLVVLLVLGGLLAAGGVALTARARRR